MTKVISVRINKKLEDIIEKYAKETKSEQSDIIRDLINSGSIFKAIKGYSEGKYSIGKAANLADFPLTEFMDLVMGLGIKSRIDLDSIIEGYENLKKYL